MRPAPDAVSVRHAQAPSAPPVVRLDERLKSSPFPDGYQSRSDFREACAHAGAKPDWALSAAGLAGLRGRGGGPARTRRADREGDDDEPLGLDGDDVEANAAEPARETAVNERMADVFAAVDAAIAQADRTLAGEAATQAQRAPERDPPVYDLDWDEDARLGEWRAVVDQTRALPPTLTAAVAVDAWAEIEPLQHTPWLGRLLASAVMRARGKTRWHLSCLHAGLKTVPRERRRSSDPASRLLIQFEAMTAAAEAGLKDHDRWLNLRTLLARKLAGRRSTSRLPALLDYVLTRPIVLAGMIAEELRITPRAAQDLVAELGLREATGRGRYRAWGVLWRGRPVHERRELYIVFTGSHIPPMEAAWPRLARKTPNPVR
ncbi:RHE_PE00001 family protein (plasmid) [Nitrobacter sp. NHB1]|uniref:RHE_PE00001 family protein n=1 Tax=Nitrobacter sp. NHB1 TaxID=3119830 RepID=UPI002FFE06EF